MVRAIMDLNPHQKRAAKERAKRETKFDYCPTCRRYRWLTLSSGQWICNECGCPAEEVKNARARVNNN